MKFNEDYVIEQLMLHHGWTNEDIRVLEAVATDVYSGPSYILSADSENIENTVQCHVREGDNGYQLKTIHLGSWGADGIIGDFFPTGIRHVQRMFKDVNEIFVNTQWDEVFFGSEGKLEDQLYRSEEENYPFEEWKEEHEIDEDDGDAYNTYETYLYHSMEHSWQDWMLLSVTDILELFVGPTCAREIAWHL